MALTRWLPDYSSIFYENWSSTSAALLLLNNKNRTAEDAKSAKEKGKISLCPFVPLRLEILAGPTFRALSPLRADGHDCI
jgi:hypothetical protein